MQKIITVFSLNIQTILYNLLHLNVKTLLSIWALQNYVSSIYYEKNISTDDICNQNCWIKIKTNKKISFI